MNNPMDCQDDEAVSVVCAVLMDNEGHVLAVKRPLGRQLGGLWEFPGGKIELGESAETALLRELKEELDLNHSELGKFHNLRPVMHAYDFAVIQLIPMLIHCCKRPNFTLSEHTDFCWIHPEKATNLVWAPADLPILRELLS